MERPPPPETARAGREGLRRMRAAESEAPTIRWTKVVVGLVVEDDEVDKQVMIGEGGVMVLRLCVWVGVGGGMG